jgi:hypothetical protein
MYITKLPRNHIKGLERLKFNDNGIEKSLFSKISVRHLVL